MSVSTSPKLATGLCLCIPSGSAAHPGSATSSTAAAAPGSDLKPQVEYITVKNATRRNTYIMIKAVTTTRAFVYNGSGGFPPLPVSHLGQRFGIRQGTTVYAPRGAVSLCFDWSSSRPSPVHSAENLQGTPYATPDRRLSSQIMGLIATSRYLRPRDHPFLSEGVYHTLRGVVA